MSQSSNGRGNQQGRGANPGRNKGRGGRGRGRGGRNTNSSNGRGGRGGGGGGRGSMTCYNCQGEGHMSRDCPNTNGGGRGRNGRGGSGGGRGGRGGRYSCAEAQGGNTGRAYNRSNTSDAVPKAKNGEKGADIHTVSEEDRIRLTRFLMALRESGEETTSTTLPPDLTNTERKFVHSLSMQLGLVSKSHGKGEKRCITVSKRAEKKKKTGTGDDEEETFPILHVGERGLLALQKHMSAHPPSETDRMESYETGSALSGSNTDDAALSSVLKGMGLTSNHKAKQRVIKPVRVDLNKRTQYHAAAQKQKRADKSYSRMTKQRQSLPAWSYQARICETVSQNPVTVLSGETGCGKSTQVPQFLLDHDPTASIVVTQPRRISAISVAERVASEQCLEPIGGMVGYQVRLESATSRDTQLLFLTPGVLLRKLQSSPTLGEFTYVIIDEIHERDKYTEFLLIALRDLLPSRPDLRIVLMSATLQTDALVNYWYDAGGQHQDSGAPGQISIPGRTFPVQEFFLEDILTMTKYLDEKQVDSMDQLEAAMAMLIASQKKDSNNRPAQKKKKKAKPVNKTDGKIVQQPPPPAANSFVCVMCQKGGFANPGELGAHVAFCDGGVGESMEALESRVRNSTDGVAAGGLIDETQFEDYDVSGDPNGVLAFEEYDVSGSNTPEEAFEDYAISDGDDDDQDTPTDKWDGESPFDMTPDDALAEPVTTKAQDELLDQYQSMHDDEKIDDALLLEVLHLIVASSYGEGAVLVFFPGWGEITEFSMLLESTPPFRDRGKYIILPLHSGIPSKEQKKVFQRPPKGVRKIILSTNIAETSVTIDDVSFVVDTGRAKEKNYDPHLKTSTLAPTWVSQASAKQRKGRAGRTKRGVAFRLFSRRRHDSFRPFVESELLRTPLEEMCLQSKQLGLAPGGPEDSDGVPAFLAKAMSPPHLKSVSNALELLVDLGAMEAETNALTSLGRCLSVLSLEPRVGKMVIYSHLLGCARAAACMGVAMSYKSPFILPPPDMRRSADSAKVALSRGSESDQVTILYAVSERDKLVRQSGQGAFNAFCRRNFLGTSTLQMIGDLRQNVSRELGSLGFPNTKSLDGYHNRHDREGDLSLWQAAIAAGLYPNVAFRKRGEVNFSTMTNRKAKIHISSLNAARGQPLNGKSQVAEGEVEFVAFGEMVRGVASFTMSQTTHLASALPLILLCGNTLRVHPVQTGGTPMAILSLDDWIVLSCPPDTASALVILRKRLESAFWRITGDPSAGMSHLTATERDAVETVGRVLQSGHGMAPARLTSTR